MAKATAPLFSFTARGALAKALVYFPWKGINCVRQYVIPTNPQTDLQTSQRNKLTAAVTAFHAASYTTLDLSAWTRFAGTLAKVMTGFNAMCRAHINEAVAGGTWEAMSDVRASAVVTTGFNVDISKASGGNAPVLRWGTRATYMPNNVSMGDLTGDEWEEDVTGMEADTDVYYTVDVGAAGTDFGRVGIYKQRTAAS